MSTILHHFQFAVHFFSIHPKLSKLKRSVSVKKLKKEKPKRNSNVRRKNAVNKLSKPKKNAGAKTLKKEKPKRNVNVKKNGVGMKRNC